jgi:hypothetical protein
MAVKVDWAALEPAIRAAHARGCNGAEVVQVAYALGVRVSANTIYNHMTRYWGLYFRDPRVRQPWTAEQFEKLHKTKLESERRVSMNLRKVLGHDLGAEKKDGRECYRPPVLPHRTLTAHILGDPQPGRTPWAA